MKWKKNCQSNMPWHHTIPISMNWEHCDNNIIQLSESNHTRLHNTQDVPYRVLRKFRERTNWLLVPNDYYWGEYHDLMSKFFSNANELPKDVSVAQINSLLRQANNAYLLDVHHSFDTTKLTNKALVHYIDEKKRVVEKILCQNMS